MTLSEIGQPTPVPWSGQESLGTPSVYPHTGAAGVVERGGGVRLRATGGWPVPLPTTPGGLGRRQGRCCGLRAGRCLAPPRLLRNNRCFRPTRGADRDAARGVSRAGPGAPASPPRRRPAASWSGGCRPPPTAAARPRESRRRGPRRRRRHSVHQRQMGARSECTHVSSRSWRRVLRTVLRRVTRSVLRGKPVRV